MSYPMYFVNEGVIFSLVLLLQPLAINIFLKYILELVLCLIGCALGGALLSRLPGFR